MYSSSHSKWLLRDDSQTVHPHIISKSCQFGEQIEVMPLGDLYFPAFEMNNQEKFKMMVFNPTPFKTKRKAEAEPIMVQKAKAAPSASAPVSVPPHLQLANLHSLLMLLLQGCQFMALFGGRSMARRGLQSPLHKLQLQQYKQVHPRRKRDMDGLKRQAC